MMMAVTVNLPLYLKYERGEKKDQMFKQNMNRILCSREKTIG